MERNAHALILALLCILAISLAAATLSNPQQPTGAGEGGHGVGTRDGGAPSQSGNGTTNKDANNPILEGKGDIFKLGPLCISALMSPAFGIVLLAFCLILGFVAYRRDSLAPAIAVLITSAIVLLPAWLLLTSGCYMNTPKFQKTDQIPSFTFANKSSDAANGASGTETMVSPLILIIALVVVAVLFAFVAYRASGDDTVNANDPVPAREPDDSALAAVGAVAGEAADRIEGAADMDNEVYRAWHEMTTHIDVSNPDSSTPEEFATAAEDAGMDPEHVDELTQLFLDVRYGGDDATADREERAVAALRAIEDRYADGDEA